MIHAQIKQVVTITLTTAFALSLFACEKTGNGQSAETSESELLLHVPSPDWRDQIIYFLMIDRFNDGDKSNNDLGAGEFDPSKESHFSGGDIPGIIEQLGYIENLGATSLWITPPVANQWWSEASQYGGYHGYWATDFSDIDQHFGDLQSYKALSDQLHRKGMYLIQDIVVNHTGNFFNYSDTYNPKDTAENFILLESENPFQQAPTQAPFDLIERLNPEHVKADIYHWTPSITDYNKDDQYRYQLAMLADINTENSVVIDKMKQIYGDWIKRVGVDAFRIDTVRYVDHQFFHHFMHDSDGVLASARQTGRDNFLSFGEVFDTSKPFQNDAEQRVASYLGDDSTPMLNSIIGFPLYFDLNTVFGQGKPTAHLAYRLQQHLDIYPDPSVIPNFVDNHDTTRFLSAGNVEGLKQALTTIFTIPGIPIIYQGTEQAMVDTRQAMFAGGFATEEDAFNQQSEMYQYIKRLSALRTSDKIFSRGEMEILASSGNGPGALVYKRTYQGRTVLVIFNSSEHAILLSQVQLEGIANPLIKPLLMENIDGNFIESDIAINQGYLTASLPKKSVFIAEVVGQSSAPNKDENSRITIDKQLSATVLIADSVINGKSDLPDQPILIVKNDNLDQAIEVTTDAKGDWQYNFPVRDLGKGRVKVQAFAPSSKAVSNIIYLEVFVEKPELDITVLDQLNDDHGRNGNYQAPTQVNSVGQMDIIKAQAEVAGDVMRLTLTMRTVTDAWKPSNGFDNVAVNVFFDSKEQDGLTLMPNLQGHLPDPLQWNAAHYAYGWGNFSFSPEHSTATHVGKKFPVAPTITVNTAQNTIMFTYRASELNMKKWLGTKLYISTWDKSGEGAFRDLSPEGSDWTFSGANSDGVRVLDEVTMLIK